MSFRIISDLIEYEYRPFARIVAPECSTLRSYAEDEIWLFDPKKREADDMEWKESVEKEHAEIVTELKCKITDLETENKNMAKLLDAIDDGMTALELIENYRVETAKWREIATFNKNAYETAMQRKRRSPRAKGA